MKKHSAATLLLLATAGGCSEAAIPDVTYHLERTATGTLPVVLRSTDGCRHLLTGGTLIFTGRATFQSSYAIEKHCGAEVQRVPLGTRGTVSFRADTAIFIDSLGTSGRGHMAADSVVVDGPGHRLIYRRRQ